MKVVIEMVSELLPLNPRCEVTAFDSLLVLKLSTWLVDVFRATKLVIYPGIE
jgi:hypothetical protein